jgi:hypothetical protein
MPGSDFMDAVPAIISFMPIIIKLNELGNITGSWTLAKNDARRPITCCDKFVPWRRSRKQRRCSAGDARQRSMSALSYSRA